MSAKPKKDVQAAHLQVVIPSDATACIHEDLAEAALKMMELNMAAEITEAADVDFKVAVAP